MLRLVFVPLLIAATIAAAFLSLRRRKTLLGRIQIVLTVLFIIAFYAGMKMSSWLHSMAYADPVRQKWQPILDLLGTCLWFGTLVPWFLFTIFHVVWVLKKKSAKTDGQ